MGSGRVKLFFCDYFSESFDLIESFEVNFSVSIAILSPPKRILMQVIDKELSSI
jgi:hypothetical protein